MSLHPFRRALLPLLLAASALLGGCYYPYGPYGYGYGYYPGYAYGAAYPAYYAPPVVSGGVVVGVGGGRY